MTVPPAPVDVVDTPMEDHAGYDSDGSFMTLVDALPFLNDPPSIDMLVDDIEPFYPTTGLWTISIGEGDVTVPAYIEVSSDQLDMLFPEEALPPVLWILHRTWDRIV